LPRDAHAPSGVVFSQWRGVVFLQQVADLASEWVGERSPVGIDDCGRPEFDAAAADGDVPTLQMHLLMVP
jgi:hypothetical protein